MTLSELFKGSNYDLDAAHEQIRKVADEEGLPYGAEHKMTYQSKTAQMLGAWAVHKLGTHPN